MISKLTPCERTLTYMTHEAGGTTGDTYNGVAAASTTASAMAQAVGASGKYIDISGFNRAKVTVFVGAITVTATVKAWTSDLGVIATDASMVQVPGWEIDLTGTSDHSVLCADLDLRGLAGNALWIEHNGSDATTVISVELFDAQNEPTSQVITATNA